MEALGETHQKDLRLDERVE